MVFDGTQVPERADNHGDSEKFTDGVFAGDQDQRQGQYDDQAEQELIGQCKQAEDI